MTVFSSVCPPQAVQLIESVVKAMYRLDDVCEKYRQVGMRFRLAGLSDPSSGVSASADIAAQVRSLSFRLLLCCCGFIVILGHEFTAGACGCVHGQRSGYHIIR